MRKVKATELRMTITVSRMAKTIALCIELLEDSFNVEFALRTIAARFGYRVVKEDR